MGQGAMHSICNKHSKEHKLFGREGSPKKPSVLDPKVYRSLIYYTSLADFFFMLTPSMLLPLKI